VREQAAGDQDTSAERECSCPAKKICGVRVCTGTEVPAHILNDFIALVGGREAGIGALFPLKAIQNQK
jgi:hypothetical protein